MKVTFINSKNNERELGIVPTVEQAEQIIKDFLREKNFKSYYFKISMFPHKKLYDVGSWSEFFIVYNDDNIKLNTVPLWSDTSEI